MNSQEKIKVLLIDDERFLLDVYSIKFLKEGFDVFMCRSADEGLKALREGYTPDAILFDLNMPEKNGFEFLEAITSTPALSRCLKVALTNEGQDAEIQRILALGADAHLLKVNYTPAEVVETVTALLAKKRGTL